MLPSQDHLLCRDDSWWRLSCKPSSNHPAKRSSKLRGSRSTSCCRSSSVPFQTSSHSHNNQSQIKSTTKSTNTETNKRNRIQSIDGRNPNFDRWGFCVLYLIPVRLRECEEREKKKPPDLKRRTKRDAMVSLFIVHTYIYIYI